MVDTRESDQILNEITDGIVTIFARHRMDVPVGQVRQVVRHMLNRLMFGMMPDDDTVTLSRYRAALEVIAEAEPVESVDHYRIVARVAIDGQFSNLSMARLIDASPLGGPAAKAIRARTPRAVVTAILRRLRASYGPPDETEPRS